MSNYQGVSNTIFEEPEYRDQAELLLAIYIITEMDNIGVCRINHRRMAIACKTSAPKIRSILEYFCKLGKCIPSLTGKYLWWKSAIHHKLYQGHYSEKQLKNVVNLLSKWEVTGEFDGVFTDGFAALVLQHYVVKYSFPIPIPNGTAKVRNTDINTYTYSNSNSQSGASTYVDGGNQDKLNPPCVKAEDVDF